MIPRIRYLGYGTALALAATGLGVLISWLLDFNWMVFSTLLLVLLMLAILSNTVSSAGGGPTMRPSALAGASNPFSVASSSMSLEDLKQIDHMSEERERQQPRTALPEHRYRWVALPSGIAILGILLSAFL